MSRRRRRRRSARRFTFLGLVTGSIWGKPMWGAWWVWDARLTSFLVLFIMYLGLIALWRAFDDPARAGRVAAVLILVGFVNIPIIKFSVDWWNTLHQPASILRVGGPTIDPVDAVAAPGHARGFRAAVRRRCIWLRCAPRSIRRRIRAGRTPRGAAAAEPRRRRAGGARRMTYPGYIVAAYGATALVLIGMIAWVVARSARAEAQAGAARGRGARGGAGTLDERAGAGAGGAARGGLRRSCSFRSSSSLRWRRSSSSGSAPGDPSRVPSALIDKPVPDFSLPPLREGGRRPCRRGPRARRPSRERLGVLVRAVPARASDPDAACRRSALRRWSASTTRTCRRTRVRFLGALGNPVRARSAPIATADRHRLGRLRRAGDLRRQGRRDPPQVHRPADGRALAAELMPAVEKALGELVPTGSYSRPAANGAGSAASASG